MPTYDIKQFAKKETIKKNNIHPLFLIFKINIRKPHHQKSLFKIIGKKGLYSKNEKYVDNFSKLKETDIKNDDQR